MKGRFPKEVLVAMYSKTHRLAQMAVKMKDVVGALAAINAITAGEGVDIRQSTTFSVREGKYAVYNAFVTLPSGYELSILTKKLAASKFVLDVTAEEGVEGGIVDTEAFPVIFAGQRSVLLGTGALVQMMDAIQSVYGSGGSSIIFQQGTDYGRALTTQLAKTLTKEYMVRNYRYGLLLLQAMGWGVPTVVKAKDDLTDVTVKIEECFECTGRGKGERAGFFMAGFLVGIFSFLADKDLRAEETKCIAAGDAYCEFSIR